MGARLSHIIINNKVLNLIILLSYIEEDLRILSFLLQSFGKSAFTQYHPFVGNCMHWDEVPDDSLGHSCPDFGK